MNKSLEGRIAALEGRLEMEGPKLIVLLRRYGAKGGPIRFAWARDDKGDLIERRCDESEAAFDDRAAGLAIHRATAGRNVGDVGVCYISPDAPLAS